MRGLQLFFPLLFFIFSANAADDCNVRGVEPDAPVLCGNAVQGGLIYGESPKYFVGGDRADAAYADNVFALGLPMDAPKELTLRFCKIMPDGGVAADCKSFAYVIRQRKYDEQKIMVDDKFITYPPGIQKRIDDENAKAAAVRGRADFSFIGFMDWRYPFDKKWPASGFYGSRRVFNGHPKSPHRGLDIAAPRGTKVHPIGAGVVVLAVDSYMSGKMAMVSHGYGVFSLYAHLDKISVAEGDIVSGDSVIGIVGATGRASGPHLHLGLYFNQIPLDPELLF
jgi:murein DD-endopeptidase MepM/ murein hydrolase activator NlpD